MPPRKSPDAEDCDHGQRAFCGEKFGTVFDKLDRLTALISGNGEPGINERLRILETERLASDERQKAERLAVERRQNRLRNLIWGVFSAVAILAATQIWRSFFPA